MKTRILIAVLACAILPVSAAGQAPPAADPGHAERTREDLQELLVWYQDVSRSPAYSAGVREDAARQISYIRQRLDEGDFRLGDRVALYVQGEPDLPDTLTVQAGPIIILPIFGEISLHGVLRSEIQAHLTERLGMFIREPVVQAKGLMRVSVQGSVTQPGFYHMAADVLISDALMVAGGPAGDADMGKIRVERGTEIVADGESLQESIRQGLTLDQLNLQAGDQLFVPAEGESLLQNFGVVVGIIGGIAFLFVR